jgi:hypothetical protein
MKLKHLILSVILIMGIVSRQPFTVKEKTKTGVKKLRVLSEDRGFWLFYNDSDKLVTKGRDMQKLIEYVVNPAEKNNIIIHYLREENKPRNVILKTADDKQLIVKYVKEGDVISPEKARKKQEKAERMRKLEEERKKQREERERLEAESS